MLALDKEMCHTGAFKSCKSRWDLDVVNLDLYIIGAFPVEAIFVQTGSLKFTACTCTVSVQVTKVFRTQNIPK